MRITDLPISIHALREEGDFILPRPNRAASHFYPRPPRGGRPRPGGFSSKRCPDFYPRPPRGGRPLSPYGAAHEHQDFYPRPPRGGRQSKTASVSGPWIFLSTPSARRATSSSSFRSRPAAYFYPRPPRGGRPAPMAASGCTSRFLSTPSARRATCRRDPLPGGSQNFYPRPPRGGRQGRRYDLVPTIQFLSTPSARRATATRNDLTAQIAAISIHALREEGDGLPCRVHRRGSISIHALREEGDDRGPDRAGGRGTFLSTPSARRATAKTEKNISAFVSL